MKILYCAQAIRLDRSHGGATHAREVTNGLHALGHDLRVVGRGDYDTDLSHQFHARLTLTRTPPLATLLMTPSVRRIVRAWEPDVVMERYYTFAGGGMLAAHQRSIPSLLEVNAPVIDPPGSRKDRVDALLGRPMQRWANRQCTWATAIVTPLAATVPSHVHEKVVALPWGANVHLFDPDRYPVGETRVETLRRRYSIPHGAPVVGFTGSFRVWHGAADAVRAFHLIRQRIPDARLLFVGDGPERAAIERAIPPNDASQVIFAGAVPYEEVAPHLALVDVAVAPFAPRRHEPLRHFGFYWSPLKIYEALAMAIPVVTTDIPPLTDIVAGCGDATPEGDSTALADAVIALLQDEDRRRAAGRLGRERVIQRFSWEAHCRALDTTLRAMVA